MLWRGKGIVNSFVVRKMLEIHNYVSNSKDVYSLTPELVEYLGPEAIENAGIKDVNSVKRVPFMNRLCSQNCSKLIEMFKKNDQYKMKVGETEVDDGFYL
jgi:hypothetical protein